MLPDKSLLIGQKLKCQNQKFKRDIFRNFQTLCYHKKGKKNVLFCGFRGLCKKEKAPLIFSNNLSESTTGKYIYRMIYEKLFADPKNRKKIHCIGRLLCFFIRTSASTSIGIESRVNFCSGCLMLFQERNTIMQTVKPKLNQWCAISN